ncbi:hypothetical protein DSO57_1029363 [Entomophthora muscae]|uniref:Uncharacterized protein n=1 Tax=Entomophthora muscae TaxID=34485 RepID=A0ACC2RFU0_9FUNG|nr:hypothetical protein DSO57_1029363 [Entomophthora muscae]
MLAHRPPVSVSGYIEPSELFPSLAARATLQGSKTYSPAYTSTLAARVTHQGLNALQSEQQRYPSGWTTPHPKQLKFPAELSHSSPQAATVSCWVRTSSPQQPISTAGWIQHLPLVVFSPTSLALPSIVPSFPTRPLPATNQQHMNCQGTNCGWLAHCFQG